jgi:hypothetical protein
MRTLVVCLLVLVLAAHAAQAEDVGNHLERDTIERWGDAPRQLLLWADAFEDIGLNYALNFFFGIAEILAGTILISHGRRQLDFTNPARGKELRRVANRTAGEVVKTVLGHILRLVGVARGAAGLFLGMAHLF